MLSIHLQDPMDRHSNVSAVVRDNDAVEFDDPYAATCIEFILLQGQHHFAMLVGEHTFMCYLSDPTLGGLCDPDKG